MLGVGRDRAAAFRPYRVTVDHTPIAFLAADASPLESRSPVWEAGPGSAGIAAAHGERTHALLTAVRRAAAHDEVVAVYLHWGTEGHACPSPAQRGLASSLAAAGADVVVGSHAHVQQGAGWLGDTYVAYGLGNFLWYHDGVPDTGVLRVRVEDGHVVSDGWAPARIPQIGPPAPVHGRARSAAVARWRSLRGCAQLRPVSDFGGDDERSMAADNSSGFKCRTVAGSQHWSAHAYGAAIDVNLVENPDLHDGSVRPEAGRAFARLVREAGASLPPGAIRADDIVVRAFAEIGWEWGGQWSVPDYQHFSAAP